MRQQGALHKGRHDIEEQQAHFADKWRVCIPELFLVVVALLAAQWVVVAGVLLLATAIVGGGVALVKRLARSAAGTRSED